MSKLETNTIDTISGSTTLTLGGTNANAITIPSGVTLSGTSLALTGNIGLGGATPTTSGTGITFPATASASTDANTLDDYEEGTWTPTFTSGANTLTITGGTQNYKYIKIGKLCFISIDISNATVSGSTSASDQRITLPFTAPSGIRQSTSNVAFNTSGGLRYTTPDWIYGVMEATIISLYGSDNLGYNPQPGAPTTGAGTYFFLTATYEVA